MKEQERNSIMIEVQTIIGAYVGWVFDDEYFAFTRGDIPTLTLTDPLLLQPGGVEDGRISYNLIDIKKHFLIVSPPVLTRMLGRDEVERIRAMKSGLAVPQKNVIKGGK